MGNGAEVGLWSFLALSLVIALSLRAVDEAEEKEEQ